MKTFSFVHFGMPCESWSRARKWNGGPPPLRDNDSFLYGYDYLTGSNRIRVEQGNALLKATFLLALAAIAAGTPWTIENPFSSRAWLTFEMTKLQELGALPQQVHYCQYGKPWKKATTFLGWKIPSLLLKQCAGSFLWAMLCFWSKTSRVRRPKFPRGLSHSFGATLPQGHGCRHCCCFVQTFAKLVIISYLSHRILRSRVWEDKLMVVEPFMRGIFTQLDFRCPYLSAIALSFSDLLP